MNRISLFLIFLFACDLSIIQAQDTLFVRVKSEVPVISRHDSLLFRSVFGDSLQMAVDYSVLKFLRNGISSIAGSEQPGPDYVLAAPYLAGWSSITGDSWNPVTGQYSAGPMKRTDLRIFANYYGRIPLTRADSVYQFSTPRKRVRYFANQLYDTLHAHMSFSDGERVRMKNLLKDFRLRSKKLPTIYSLIDKKYGGNVDAYVDNLFDKSVFSSERRLKRFIRTVNNDKKLLRDPLVLYWTSMMQYNVLLMVADIVNE